MGSHLPHPQVTSSLENAVCELVPCSLNYKSFSVCLCLCCSLSCSGYKHLMTIQGKDYHLRTVHTPALLTKYQDFSLACIRAPARSLITHLDGNSPNPLPIQTSLVDTCGDHATGVKTMFCEPLSCTRQYPPPPFLQISVKHNANDTADRLLSP